MKAISYLLVMMAFIAVTTSCNKINYRKTKTGLLYKIIPSDSKDSTVKFGQWLKINYVQKWNDSVLQSSYGKMPVYQQVMLDPTINYNPAEIFPLLKKGDSAVIIMYVDSLMKKPGINLPPFFKKGDRLTLNIRIMDVFRVDSLKQIDESAEAQRDAPRLQKERAEQEEKMEKMVMEQKAKELEEAERTGEADKERKAMEAYLAARHITAQKAGKGTYVVITDPGTGPQAVAGKYVNVKYTGKILANDSTFTKDDTYAFQLGKGKVIDGWDEGLELLKQGGKATLYIPGFRAYGKNPPPQSPFKQDEPLIFNVELLNVTDSLPPQAVR